MGKPKNADGPPVSVIPASLVQGVVGDGRWRTMTELVVALSRVIRPEDAVRASDARPRRRRHLSVDEKVVRGQRRLIKATLDSMYCRRLAEFRSRDGAAGRPEAEYRVLPPGEVSTANRRDVAVPPEAFGRPSATVTGLSRVVVAAAVRAHPGATLAELEVVLRGAFAPVPDLLPVLRGKGNQGRVFRHPDVTAGDPDWETQVRRAVLSWFLRDMLRPKSGHPQVREDRTTRYYPVTQVLP